MALLLLAKLLGIAILLIVCALFVPLILLVIMDIIGLNVSPLWMVLITVATCIVAFAVCKKWCWICDSWLELKNRDKNYLCPEPLERDDIHEGAAIQKAEHIHRNQAVESIPWTCSNCGTENSANYGQCKKCGQYRKQ